MTSRPAWLSLVLALAPACASEGSLDAGESDTSSDTSDTSDTGEPDPALCRAIALPVSPSPGAQQLELVAERSAIPGLADQPTPHGQILGSLFAFDGRLHLGYGDYSANTGPILALAWDPLASTFVELGILPTEEVLWFRPGLATLYSPAIDPDGHQESGGIHRLDCGADQWHVGAPIEGAVHVYDVAIQGESIYATTGSLTGQPALLMRSEDHGESWTEVLRRESAADRFSRFHFLGATPDRLFVAGQDYPAPGTAFAWLREGQAEFEPLSDPPASTLVPIVLADAMLITSFSGNPGRSDYLASWRIEAGGFVPDSPWPTLASGEPKLVAWAPDGERLLVLLAAPDGSYSVQRTDDLSPGAMAWQPLAELDPLVGDEYVSMALLLDDLYLGSKLGSLYALRELELPSQ
ncbi:hypothetical protein ACNOYE_33045 [Nannocystaceae bacterium ST9]